MSIYKALLQNWRVPSHNSFHEVANLHEVLLLSVPFFKPPCLVSHWLEQTESSQSSIWSLPIQCSLRMSPRFRRWDLFLHVKQPLHLWVHWSCLGLPLAAAGLLGCIQPLPRSPPSMHRGQLSSQSHIIWSRPPALPSRHQSASEGQHQGCSGDDGHSPLHDWPSASCFGTSVSWAQELYTLPTLGYQCELGETSSSDADSHWMWDSEDHLLRFCEDTRLSGSLRNHPEWCRHNPHRLHRKKTSPSKYKSPIETPSYSTCSIVPSLCIPLVQTLGEQWVGPKLYHL